MNNFLTKFYKTGVWRIRQIIMFSRILTVHYMSPHSNNLWCWNYCLAHQQKASGLGNLRNLHSTAVVFMCVNRVRYVSPFGSAPLLVSSRACVLWLSMHTSGWTYSRNPIKNLMGSSNIFWTLIKSCFRSCSHQWVPSVICLSFHWICYLHYLLPFQCDGGLGGMGETWMPCRQCARPLHICLWGRSYT